MTMKSEKSAGPMYLERAGDAPHKGPFSAIVPTFTNTEFAFRVIQDVPEIDAVATDDSVEIEVSETRKPV